MDFEKDPNDRRRVDPQAMRNRDAEVARLRRQGVPFRVIGERLDMSLGAVQKAVRRAQKRERLAAALAGGEPDDVVAVIADDELTCDDVTCVDDVARLNELELHRLRYFAPDSPQRVALAEWVPSLAWRAAHPPREATVYPIQDGHSWHEGVGWGDGG